MNEIGSVEIIARSLWSQMQYFFLNVGRELTSWKQVMSLNSVSLMSSVGLKGCVCVEVDPLALKEQMRKGVLNIWGEG